MSNGTIKPWHEVVKLRADVKSGELHHRRVGLQIRVPLSALDEFLTRSG